MLTSLVGLNNHENKIIYPLPFIKRYTPNVKRCTHVVALLPMAKNEGVCWPWKSQGGTVLWKSNESEFRRNSAKSSEKQRYFEGHETWTHLLRIFEAAIVLTRSKLWPCWQNTTWTFEQIFERHFEISEAQSRIFKEEFDFSRERYRIFGKWFSRGFINNNRWIRNHGNCN